MGQRSEIYVAYETQFGTKRIVARWFGWNYGERMVSRIAYTARWLQKRIKYDFSEKDLIAIVETNFDIVDHQMSDDLVSRWEGRADRISVTDNGCLNDGRGFLQVSKDGTVKYCFTSNHEITPLDCDGYMLFDTECNYPQCQWINEEYRNSERMEKCRDNIKWLTRNASLMTQEELDEFIHADYEA